MSRKKRTPKFDTSDPMYQRMKERLYAKKPVYGEGSPFTELLQSMVNEMLEGEMDSFQDEERASGRINKRNGRTSKEVMTSDGKIDISTPRDRNGDFLPEIVGKRERQLSSGLDDQILALYAQGNSVEDIRRLLIEFYGVSISSGKVSAITDRVLPHVLDWQNRELEPFYAVLYLDAIHFKVRYEGRYTTRAFYTVYAIDWEGRRDLLGLYVQSNEGATNWRHVLADLRDRGVEDVLVICTDDLTGFSEVIEDEFPEAIIQKCVVHQVRNSLKYVDDKDRKPLAKALRQIYTAPTTEQAKLELEAFEQTWKKYPRVSRQWNENWDELMAFMDFPKDMRRMIYTTNPVEALHRVIRKIIKSKAAWVSDKALTKQVFMALMQNKKSWKKNAFGWKKIQRELIELYPQRIDRLV